MSRPPAVVIAANAWFGEVFGGSFRVATELAKDFAARGHRVAYICSSPECRSDDRVEKDGVTLYRYPEFGRGGLKAGALIGHIQRSRSAMKRILNDFEPAALHGVTPLQFAGALLGCRGRTLRCSYCVASPFADELLAQDGAGKPPLKRRLAARAAAALESWNLARCDAILPMSEFTRSHMLEQFGQHLAPKMIIAPGWVEADRFHPSADRHALRRSLPDIWQTDHPVFFSVRRLEPRMGLDLLVHAAGRLKSEGRPFRVIIGGGGSQEPALRSLASEQGLEGTVFFAGRIPDGQLETCYAAADCFVLPTRALECFGLIVIESWSAGTPVIGSRSSAVPELVGRQGADWLFDVDRSDQLADRMAAFLTGRLHLPSSHRAFELARQFTPDLILPTWRNAILGDPS